MNLTTRIYEAIGELNKIIDGDVTGESHVPVCEKAVAILEGVVSSIEYIDECDERRSLGIPDEAGCFDD